LTRIISRSSWALDCASRQGVFFMALWIASSIVIRTETPVTKPPIQRQVAGNLTIPIRTLGVILFLFPMLAACGMRTMVRGQVVDATNGKPIEGAVVSMVWWAREFSSLFIPLDGGNYVLESHSEMTDSQGGFNVPNYYGYVGKDLYMGVYKKGYVCWSNERIFQKHEKASVKRKFHVKDELVIQLEPLTDDYSIERHAVFTILVETVVGTELFGEAIRNESKIAYEYLQKTNN
jgi:hypothetical protein